LYLRNEKKGGKEHNKTWLSRSDASPFQAPCKRTTSSNSNWPLSPRSSKTSSLGGSTIEIAQCRHSRVALEPSSWKHLRGNSTYSSAVPPMFTKAVRIIAVTIARSSIRPLSLRTCVRRHRRRHTASQTILSRFR
jgi:hypothetical protein